MHFGRLGRLALFASSSCVLTGALARPCAAENETPSAAELQVARALFVQAEQDEDADRWQDALEKLRLVSHVKLTAGVRYHIALCEAHVGQLARALEEYGAAQAQAHAEHAEDVLRLVGDAIADLSPRVPRLTIHVVPDFVDATVLLDASPVDRSVVGEPLAVDPGVHQVDATAPNRIAVHETVTVHERESAVLEMPLVRTAPATAAPAASAPFAAAPGAPAEHADGPGPTRIAAVAATGTAAGLAGFGLVAFVLSGRALHDAENGCAALESDAPGACNNLKTPVRAWDWTALASWTAAAVASSAAIVLWTRRPSRSSPSAQIVLGFGSLAAKGAF